MPRFYSKFHNINWEKVTYHLACTLTVMTVICTLVSVLLLALDHPFRHLSPYPGSTLVGLVLTWKSAQWAYSLYRDEWVEAGMTLGDDVLLPLPKVTPSRMRKIQRQIAADRRRLGVEGFKREAERVWTRYWEEVSPVEYQSPLSEYPQSDWEMLHSYFLSGSFARGGDVADFVWFVKKDGTEAEYVLPKLAKGGLLESFNSPLPLPASFRALPREKQQALHEHFIGIQQELYGLFWKADGEIRERARKAAEAERVEEHRRRSLALRDAVDARRAVDDAKYLAKKATEKISVPPDNVVPFPAIAKAS